MVMKDLGRARPVSSNARKSGSLEVGLLINKSYGLITRCAATADFSTPR